MSHAAVLNCMIFVVCSLLPTTDSKHGQQPEFDVKCLSAQLTISYINVFMSVRI